MSAVTPLAPGDAPSVMRGAVLAPQAVTPARPVRPEPRASERPEAQATTAAAIDTEALWRARLEEARTAARAEARAEVLAQAESLIGQAAQEAARQAEEAAKQRVDAEATRQWRQSLERLETLLKALPAAIDARLAAAEDDLLALCMDTLTQLLGEGFARTEVVRAHVSQALVRMKSQPDSRVRLHPEDLALLRAAPDFSLWEQSIAPRLQWLADPSQSVGGCLIESPQGSLDARLATQLGAFADVLRRARRATEIGIETGIGTDSDPAVTETRS